MMQLPKHTTTALAILNELHLDQPSHVYHHNDIRVSTHGVGTDSPIVTLSTRNEDEHEGLLNLAVDLADLLVSEATNNDACEWAIHMKANLVEGPLPVELSVMVCVIDALT